MVNIEQSIFGSSRACPLVELALANGVLRPEGRAAPYPVIAFRNRQVASPSTTTP